MLGIGLGIAKNNNQSAEFDINPLMDLINLQSDDLSKFTITSGKISAWTEENGITQWTQATDSRRPTLVSGVPTFSGANTSLLRASDVSAVNYSLYFIVRNSGKQDSKAVFSSLASIDYRFNWSDNRNRAVMRYNGTNSWLGYVSATGNRDNIIAIRVTGGNTMKVTINDRLITQISSNFSGQSINIGILMGLVSNATWSVNGTLKAFCMSSQQLDDETHSKVVDHLYTRYNLDSNITTDCILAIGDSNTSGSGSVVSYTRPLGVQMGLAISNLGISGAYLTPLGGVVANSIYNRRNLLISRPGTDWIIIAGGTNDVINSVSADNFYTYYREIISDIITSGHQANKIIMCTPPYQQGNARETELNNYRTKINDIANEFTGVLVYDFLQAIRDNGGDSLMLDSVHVNQTGQNLWQAGLYDLMT